MIDIKKMLYEITSDDRVFDDNVDLIEMGILDSFSFIELFTELEDNNIYLQPTQIDRNKLNTVKGIEELINDYNKNSNN